MKELLALKTVYCYYLPESRRIVNQVDSLPKDPLFSTQIPVETAQRIIEPLGFNPPLELPTVKGGKLDLDMIHVPIIDRVVDAYAKVTSGLKDFEYRYPTAGSSEAIFHCLSYLKTAGINTVYTFKGEYEGYKEYGKTMGVEVEEKDIDEDPQKIRQGVWFISNPSAIAGNIIPNEVINRICDTGHKVFLDLAYVGATKDYQFDVSHPNIPVVFMSFSKPYGLFRFRIGTTFAREPIPSLYANRWFKDINRLLVELKVAEEIGPHAIFPKYRPVQEAIIDELNREFDLNIRPSDALLLGNIPQEDAQGLSKENQELIETYRRGPGFRFCITPYFEKREKQLTSK